MRFIVTTSPGLETLLQAEIAGLIEKKVEVGGSGAVSFEAEGFGAAATVMVGSRLASRVLLSLRAFSAKTNAMLYDQVRRVHWTDFIPIGKTISVYAHGTTVDTDYTISYAPLRIKDALCDEIKKRGRERPDVNRQDADCRIEAFFNSGRCELSLDLTGVPLHKRGYRRDGAEAPLRESRAAGLLLFAGYTGARPLVDPFCGSGTIAIEGALIALKKPPALVRPLEQFALAKIFPETLALLKDSLARLKSQSLSALPAPILASDISSSALQAAGENAKRMGVAKWIEFREQDALSLEIKDADIVTNPPYGERMDSEEGALKTLGAFTRQVKHHCEGARLSLILPAGPLENAVGFKPKKKLALENGAFHAKFLQYEIYSGRGVRS